MVPSQTSFQITRLNSMLKPSMYHSEWEFGINTHFTRASASNLLRILAAGLAALQRRHQESFNQCLLFWLFKGGFKVSSGIVYSYRSRYGTGFDSSKTASPVNSLRHEMLKSLQLQAGLLSSKSPWYVVRCPFKHPEIKVARRPVHHRKMYAMGSKEAGCCQPKGQPNAIIPDMSSS